MISRKNIRLQVLNWAIYTTAVAHNHRRKNFDVVELFNPSGARAFRPMTGLEYSSRRTNILRLWRSSGS